MRMKLSSILGVPVWLGTTAALAGPTSSAWVVDGPDDTASIAAAALAGWYAAGDSFEDVIEVRDVQHALVHTVTKQQILGLLPWMTLDGSTDGVGALAFSDSGRLLFVEVHDAAPSPDGHPSDAILRFDTQTGVLSVFARVEVSTSDHPWPHASLAHFKGRLYAGVLGGVQVFRAQMNDTAGVPLSFSSGASGAVVNGLAIDRGQSLLYASWNGQIFRSSLGSASLTFAPVGSLPGVRALAYSDHIGGASNVGLYALESTSDPEFHRLWFIPPGQARGQQSFAPTAYVTGADDWHDLCPTADGALLAAADEDAVRISDTSDTRLSYIGWRANEFAQVVAFGKSLISPDGEPPGWVIDADVQLGWTRFHPATPDGACWTVLLLLMSDELNADPQAQVLVRSILQRYSGLSPDGIAPERTADGIYRHWIDPYTGSVKPGWDPEYATMSTMKIALAAARAAAYYPQDPSIQQSARAIICAISNWDSYLQPGTDAMFLKAVATGGPDTQSAARPFHEGFIFVEQAARYGSSPSADAYGRWLDRDRWPTAALISGREVTCQTAGFHLPAFVSLYELLVCPDFRASAGWQTHIANLRLSNAAWTDDNGPKYSTVFSAGTTRSIWGGYHADSLSDHPGDVTTLPSLMAFAAGTTVMGTPDSASAVGAYHAYRRGARQTFLGGASILYRRSNVDQSYQPDSAGLPDVALGALGLAELIRPGSVSLVLGGEYLSCSCAADFDGDGFITGQDFDLYVLAFEAGEPAADFDRDGFVSGVDFDLYVYAYEAGC